jgi:hypothetical protein
MGVVQWICWLAGWGRFKPRPQLVVGQGDLTVPPSAIIGSTGVERRIRFVIAELFAKLIDDFRHLLALIIVIIFMMTIGYALWVAGGNVANLNASLQAVTGSFSGIIGVIIGYYFGESSARGGTENPEGIRQGGPPVQGAPTESASGPKKAPLPPEE